MNSSTEEHLDNTNSLNLLVILFFSTHVAVTNILSDDSKLEKNAK